MFKIFNKGIITSKVRRTHGRACQKNAPGSGEILTITPERQSPHYAQSMECLWKVCLTFENTLPPLCAYRLRASYGKPISQACLLAGCQGDSEKHGNAGEWNVSAHQRWQKKDGVLRKGQAFGFSQPGTGRAAKERGSDLNIHICPWLDAHAA